jgi:hypothetical protein
MKNSINARKIVFFAIFNALFWIYPTQQTTVASYNFGGVSSTTISSSINTGSQPNFKFPGKLD